MRRLPSPPPIHPFTTVSDWVTALDVPKGNPASLTVPEPGKSVDWAVRRLRLVTADPSAGGQIWLKLNDAVVFITYLIAHDDFAWFKLDAPINVGKNDVLLIGADSPCTVALAGLYVTRGG